MCDEAALEALFQRERIDAVVHFAAFKAVGESGSKPLDYYRNNLGGLIALARTMQRHGCRRAGVQLQRHGVRQARAAADHRGLAAVGHQPLRRHQADGREHPARPRALRARLGDRAAALLQPGRRARERPDRRGPAGHAEQPDALRDAGGGGPARQAAASSATTTTRPTAPACATTSTCSTWPTATWRRCAACSAAATRCTVNLGTGRGHSVLEVVQRLRARQRPPRALRDRAAPPRRRGRVLRRPDAGARSCSAGTPRATSTRCAPTAGAGSR